MSSPHKDKRVLSLFRVISAEGKAQFLVYIGNNHYKRETLLKLKTSSDLVHNA